MHCHHWFQPWIHITRCPIAWNTWPHYIKSIDLLLLIQAWMNEWIHSLFKHHHIPNNYWQITLQNAKESTSINITVIDSLIKSRIQSIHFAFKWGQTSHVKLQLSTLQYLILLKVFRKIMDSHLNKQIQWVHLGHAFFHFMLIYIMSTCYYCSNINKGVSKFLIHGLVLYTGSVAASGFGEWLHKICFYTYLYQLGIFLYI